MTEEKKTCGGLLEENRPPEVPKAFVMELAKAIQDVFKRHIDGKLGKLFKEGEIAVVQPNPVWTAGDQEGQPVWWIEGIEDRKLYHMYMKVEVSFPYQVEED